MQIFSRTVAARFLAARLRSSIDPGTLVLAASRNAVPLARALAAELECEFDVLLFCDLCLPDDPVTPVASVSETGDVLWNPVTHGERVSEEALARRIVSDLEQLVERRVRYTPDRPPADPQGRITIMVADGIASGTRMVEALQVARAHRPEKLFCVLSSATPEALRRIRAACDGVVCLDVAASYADVARALVGATPVTEELAMQLVQGGDDPRGGNGSSA